MLRIDDQRWLRKFCRFAAWHSRYLDRGVIVVNDAGADLEVHITNGIYSLIGIAWANGSAVLLPGSRLLSAADLEGLDVAFSTLVRRLLRKHGLIDTQGRSTRKGAA